jgi:chromosome segregation protein
MYLKRVVINGFKSFGARTVVDFEPGVSAIVGPNGSGKSNVVEAVRWALGEQSVKQLRSGGRQELVFGGTPNRPKASMAEVILVFDNSSGAFPLEFDEVEIEASGRGTQAGSDSGQHPAAAGYGGRT